ncbi:type II secretion system protein E, partial [Kosakonia sp. H7A]
MEQRQPAETTMALAGAALPRGRLVFERVATALLADEMVAPNDRERIQFSAGGARNASEVHPLVLLSNLKLHAGQPPAGELGLERLTEWLATRVGM